MGKGTEQKKPAAPAVATVDNIYEQLDSAAVGHKEMSKAAKEQLKKEHDERTQREMMRRYEKAQYKIDQSLLKLRREREVAKVQKKELTHVDRLARMLMGFTVDEATIQHAVGAEDIFEKEKVDEKAQTISVKGIDGKEKTYKIGEEVPPVIDYIDYDELLKKINEWTRKEISEIDKVHDTYVKKLRAKYDEYYCYDWY